MPILEIDEHAAKVKALSEIAWGLPNPNHFLRVELRSIINKTGKNLLENS